MIFSIPTTLFILIAVFATAVCVHYIATDKKDTLKESALAILKIIFNFFEDEPQEPSPFNTAGFWESVKENLRRYSPIKQEDLYRYSYPEPGHYIVEFIGSDDNLKIFVEVLKRCVQTALQRQGYEPFIYAEAEKISEGTWYVHVYFATTPSRQKTLSEWIARKNELKRKNVAGSLGSPVDQELAADMKDMAEAKIHLRPSETLSNVKLGFDLSLWTVQKITIQTGTTYSNSKRTNTDSTKLSNTTWISS